MFICEVYYGNVDASIGLNLATVLMSALALLVSALLAYRQIGLTIGANHLPVVLDAFKEIRSVKFQDSQKYIFERLASEHDPARTSKMALPSK